MAADHARRESEKSEQDGPAAPSAPAHKASDGVLRIQRMAGNAAVGAALGGGSRRVRDVISGGGQPLEGGTRSDMESLLGHDLSSVRVHTDRPAAESATAVGAKAYTAGDNVVFGAGQFSPATPSGRRTLAHELTHVVQQRSGPVHAEPAGGGLAVSNPGDRFEQQADQMAARAGSAGGGSAGGGSAGGGAPPPGGAVKGPGPAAAPGGSMAIQRLALADKPSAWGAQNVKRSGEGVAGVFFVGASPNDIVVKPLGSTGNVEYANRFMGAMGLSAPGTARYDKTSADGTAITNLLLANKDKGRTPTEVEDQVKGANAYLVMEKVQGRSIQTLSDAEAVEFLRNTNALKDTGRIMVADAFLGNQDRLVGGRVNLGNFFYQAASNVAPGVVRTIDNDSSFKEGSVRTKRSGGKTVDGQLASKIEYIKFLITPKGRDDFITAFLARFKGAHKNNANALAEATGQEATIKAAIDQGIKDALADIRQLFETNIDLVRSVAKGYDTESEDNRDRSAAKGTALFMKSVVGGEDPDVATAKLVKYVEYRAMRDKTPSGFKWITKLVSDRGF